MTAEQFLSEFVFAARQKRTDDFRAKYRSLDALLLDDVQFLAGKGGTQEEFFHTFNHLHAAGKQIVLASDEAPPALLHFSPRLRSRFQSGLTADLSMFPSDARIALLRRKADSLHAEVDDASLEFLAGRPYSNVRELEGALNRVLAYARLTGQRADLSLARSAIKCVQTEPAPSPPKPERIIDAVCSYYDVPRQALGGQGRGKRVTTARHVAMYLLRQDACQPLTHIGRLFGDRDHSTVLYACRKIERESTAIPQTSADLATIRGQITLLGRLTSSISTSLHPFSRSSLLRSKPCCRYVELCGNHSFPITLSTSTAKFPTTTAAVPRFSITAFPTFRLYT